MTERPEWSRTRYITDQETGDKRPMNDLERIVWLLNRLLDKLEGTVQ